MNPLTPVTSRPASPTLESKERKKKQSDQSQQLAEITGVHCTDAYTSSAYSQLNTQERRTAQSLRSSVPQEAGNNLDDFLSDQQLAVKYALDTDQSDNSVYNRNELLEAADDAALEEAIKRSLTFSNDLICAPRTNHRNDLKSDRDLRKATIEGLVLRTTSPITAHPAQWNHFLGLLEKEIVVSEAVDDCVENGKQNKQYSQDSAALPDMHSFRVDTTNEQSFKKNMLSKDYCVIPNRGRGDCLYHSLYGRDLDLEELLNFREMVAGQRLGMEENHAANVWHVKQGLEPAIGCDVANALMKGRHKISNETYAAFQAIPGMYAGDDEVIQWCKLTAQSIVVIDIEDNSLYSYSAAGRKKENALTAGFAWQDSVLKPCIEKTGFALLKTADHWERIELNAAGPAHPR